MTNGQQREAASLPVELRVWEESGSYVALRNGQADLQVFVRDSGDTDAPASETLLILHGFPESSYSFHKNVAALGERYRRVVVFDFPGYGFSDKPDWCTYSLFEQADAALAVWKHLAIRGGHVLAHDMGTSVLTELLARGVRGLLPAWFADGIQSATFCNGNMVMERAKLRIMQVLLRTRLGRIMSRLSTRRIFHRQVRSANGGTGLTSKDIDLMFAALSYKNGKRLGWKLIKYLDERERFQNTRWLPALRDADCPVRIIWGDADAVAPVAIARYLKEHVCPAAELKILPGVGHFAQLDAPDVWNAAVCAEQ